MAQNNKTTTIRKTRVETGTTAEGKKFVHIINKAGKETYMVGGSKSWRNNNPGNLGCSDYMKSLGSLGCDAQDRSIFPDRETGNNAMERLLMLGRAYKNSPIATALKSYTKGDDSKIRENYKKHIEKRVQESIQKELESDSSLSNEEKDRIAKERTDKIMNKIPLGNLDDKPFNTVTDAMKEFEQTTPGKEIDVTSDGMNKAYLTKTPIGVDKNKHYPDLSKIDHNISLSTDPPITPTDVKDVTNKPRDNSPSNQPIATTPQGGSTKPSTMPDAKPSINSPDASSNSPLVDSKDPFKDFNELAKQQKPDILDQILHGYPQSVKDKARAEARQMGEKNKSNNASSSNSGETLEYRDGKVWRIEEDGSTRGFVKAWSK